MVIVFSWYIKKSDNENELSVSCNLRHIGHSLPLLVSTVNMETLGYDYDFFRRGWGVYLIIDYISFSFEWQMYILFFKSDKMINFSLLSNNLLVMLIAIMVIVFSWYIITQVKK